MVLIIINKVIIWVISAFTSLSVSVPSPLEMDGQHYVGPSRTVLFYSTIHFPCHHGSKVPLAA